MPRLQTLALLAMTATASLLLPSRGHAESVCSSDGTRETVMKLIYSAMDPDHVALDPVKNRFKLDDIRTSSHAENATYCKAVFSFFINLGASGQLDKTIPVAYSVETTDDGKPYVTLNPKEAE